VQELKRLGVEPLGESHEVSFSARVPARSAGANRPGFIQNRDLITSVENGELITGRNVMGVIRGSVTPDRYIVVSAHFDHVGTQRGVVHPGANDNASGAAALLAVADLLKLAPPKNSVILVWFDAEELGLLGSQAFVRTPPVPLARIVANVNADMLSRSDNGRLFVSGTQFYAAFRPLIDSVASTGFMRVERGHDGTDSREDYYRFSDQWSFHERRIPAVLVTTGNYPDLHRPADTILRANVALYVRAVSAFADLVRRLDDSYDTLFAAKPQ
jgi:Zn-dependent M28 family amino/carboxypeptidase